MYKRACVLVVPYMLAVRLQAETNQDTSNWGVPFIEAALHNNVDIHVLPCTELLFNGLDVGFTRKKHGINYYTNTPGYKKFCSEKAYEIAEMINDLIKHYNIIAIIGVEHSPSCAINYMYSHHGMLKEPGLFMHFLRDYLLSKNISIPFIGVNRRYPQKSLIAFKKHIQKAANERERTNI